MILKKTKPVKKKNNKNNNKLNKKDKTYYSKYKYYESENSEEEEIDSKQKALLDLEAERKYLADQKKERVLREKNAILKYDDRIAKGFKVFKGVVVECLPSAFYRVSEFEKSASNSKDFISDQEYIAFSHSYQPQMVIAAISVKMRRLRIDVDLGDMVEFECDPLYPQRGRIIYRYNYQRSEMSFSKKIIKIV